MIGSWLQALGRKLLGKRHFRKSRCPMRRWSARPCLEALELRTLPSTAVIDPPVPPVLPVRVAAFAAESPISTIAGDGPGLARLLQDLRLLAVPMQDALPESAATDVATAMTFPGVPQSSRNMAAMNPTNPDSANSLNPPGLPSTPEAPTSQAPASHAAANPTNDLSPDAPQDTITLPGGAATGEQPAAAMFVPTSGAPNTANIAGSWMLPAAQPGRDAGSVPTVAELESAYAAWLNPDTAAQPAQAPDAPAGTVCDPPGAAPTTAPAAPLATAETVASPAGTHESLTALADGALLQRFVAHHDQTAFATLVARHEGLVFSVCQRVLGDAQAAEDALQATFLVLARKAGALDPDRPLTGWLYLVAYHLALRLRAVAARRRRCENHAASNRPGHADNESAADLENEEIHQVLREELERLPEKYRKPLVLCYLRGQTHAEAARAIGMPRGSIAKRIGEGLERLRQCLTDRGITL